MTGPDANVTNIVASCVFKTIVNGIYSYYSWLQKNGKRKFS
jgi:hypothetical protein